MNSGTSNHFIIIHDTLRLRYASILYGGIPFEVSFFSEAPILTLSLQLYKMMIWWRWCSVRRSQKYSHKATLSWKIVFFVWLAWITRLFLLSTISCFYENVIIKRSLFFVSEKKLTLHRHYRYSKEKKMVWCSQWILLAKQRLDLISELKWLL